MNDNMAHLEEVIRKLNRDQHFQNIDDKCSIRRLIDRISPVVGNAHQDISDVFKSLQDKVPLFGDEHDAAVILFNKLELEIMLFALCQMEVEYDRGIE